jgi:alpha-glucosidase
MQELRQLVDSYGDRILLGETGEVVFYGNGRNELHSVFNFPLITKLDAPQLHQTLAERLPTIPDGAWEANTVGNHDRSRSWSFYADGQDDQRRSQMALAMVMFLRGTPVYYYGEEIGMQDGKPPAIEQFKDGLGTWFYHALRRQGKNHNEAFQVAADFFCRDRCRTPMQWANGANGGFSPMGVKTWLLVNDNAQTGVNVADQQDDPNSMLTFFRQIAQVRQAYEVLRRGNITLISDSGNVLAFWRQTSKKRVLVALNMSTEMSELRVETVTSTSSVQSVSQRIYTNYPEQTWNGETAKLILQPYEIWIGGV